jgi:unsaturated rhamnogalacturonyl hydrolase
VNTELVFPAKALVLKVAARTMKLSFRKWRFGESIALRGLISASRVTGDPEPLAYSLALLWSYLAGGVVKSPVEHVAPATELLLAYTLTGEEAFLEAPRRRADLHASFPFNAFGARFHRSDLSGWVRQIWVDCMDIDPPFLAHPGAITGEDRYFAQSAQEVIAYARSLQGAETRLFYHGFEESCARNGQLWARGNGWALMGMVETLKFLPKLYPQHEEFQQGLHTHCEGLAKYQDREGLWHTLLVQPKTYLKSTLATMAAYALREPFSAGILNGSDFGQWSTKHGRRRCA